MAIIKRPTHTTAPSKTAEAFIQGAPDAVTASVDTPASQGVMKGSQRQVTFAMPPELLAKVDEAARKLSLTRAGYMKMALTRAINNDTNNL